MVMAPGLPLFSGSEPTPHDEGTYEQWKFQVKGMQSSCPESTVRSALIMSVRGEASELVGFMGFNSPLLVILEAIDKRLVRSQLQTVYSKNSSNFNKTKVKGFNIS